jgi:AcrR family transcriptional regulator
VPDLPSSKRRERLPQAERREQILQAARQVFLESGFTGARTKEIADRAGITEAFLFRRFSSKEEMYQAAVEQPVAEAFDGLAADIKAIGDECGEDRALFIRRVSELCLEFFAVWSSVCAVALFSELGMGRVFYQNDVTPRLRRIRKVIADHAGVPGVDKEILRRALFGGPWAIAFDHDLTGRQMDVPAIAAGLTSVFAPEA